jgi:Amidohydrolase family
MKVALFITCFNDLLFPDVGKAVVEILNRLGHEVEFPAGQTFWEPDGSYRYRSDLIDRAVADDRWINPTLYGGACAGVEGLEAKQEREGPLSIAEEAELASSRSLLEELMDGVRRMIGQGAKITAGSDTAWRWGRAGGLAREVQLLGQSGMSNAQAIVSGTSGGAESIGLGDVAGRLAVGRRQLGRGFVDIDKSDSTTVCC